MAYTELIKNFERIRGYMREFYVYGFKSRDEFTRKSGRSYDNERRRVESWLGDYMGFHQNGEGKRIFLSIDSRREEQNPLYQALKAKSFTNGDITLHFILLDILRCAALSGAGWRDQQEITAAMDGAYLSCFRDPVVFDPSTVRRKLKEYVELGLLQRRKEGKRMVYRLAPSCSLSGWNDSLAFFSETAPCGSVGAFLLERHGASAAVDRADAGQHKGNTIFRFKHHYITHALDSEILYQLLLAISGECEVSLKNGSRWSPSEKVQRVVPLKIYISVGNGRRYLLGYHLGLKRFFSYRLDYISMVRMGERSEHFMALRQRLEEMEAHLWGVSLGNGRTTEHVEFTVRVEEDEDYICRRLLREKRCGTVEQVGPRLWRFTAEVYDTSEVVPWMRTFLCRIVSTRCSNRTVENQFWEDVNRVYGLYGLDEPEKRSGEDAAASPVTAGERKEGMDRAL